MTVFEPCTIEDYEKERHLYRKLCVRATYGGYNYADNWYDKWKDSKGSDFKDIFKEVNVKRIKVSDLLNKDLEYNRNDAASIKRIQKRINNLCEEHKAMIEKVEHIYIVRAKKYRPKTGPVILDSLQEFERLCVKQIKDKERLEKQYEQDQQKYQEQQQRKKERYLSYYGSEQPDWPRAGYVYILNDKVFDTDFDHAYLSGLIVISRDQYYVETKLIPDASNNLATSVILSVRELMQNFHKVGVRSDMNSRDIYNLYNKRKEQFSNKEGD